jgi:hypothetical protein
MAGLWPAGARRYSTAYLVRGPEWSPEKKHPQPPHTIKWMTCRDRICSTAKAGLWLDVNSSSVISNGGFPSPQGSFMREVGIQCFYPQFNAQLVSNQGI